MITQRNIVLIGFMGCGKTMTSNRLADILHCPVISTDALIEQNEGRSIPDIFERSGEHYFRQIEREIIRQISGKTGVIIDCGGGVVLNPENMTDLAKKGLIIYLSASAESIYKNIKNRKHRPLMDVKDPKSKINELLKIRKPLYEQANIIIDADFRSVDDIVNDTLKALKHDRK